jgi:hypothetical protein
MGGGPVVSPEAPSASMIHASAQRVQRRDLDHRSEFEPVACLEAPERLRCRAVCCARTAQHLPAARGVRYGIVIVLHRPSGRRDTTIGSARHSSHQ